MYFVNGDFGKQTVLFLTGFAAVCAGKGNAQLILSGQKEESTISALWVKCLKSGILNQTAFINNEQAGIVAETGEAFQTIREAISHILHSLIEINGEISSANMIKEEVVNAISDISHFASEASQKTLLIHDSVDLQYEAFKNLQQSSAMLNELSDKVNRMIRSFTI